MIVRKAARGYRLLGERTGAPFVRGDGGRTRRLPVRWSPIIPAVFAGSSGRSTDPARDLRRRNRRSQRIAKMN
ncbi:hypothetical protein FH063_004712 [Azospirillum argentinense]|uniref:Uncharacterized protein n=1 Tax=Azospirillum argentinense TaxID=2970906 RepID=A0A5B0L022_9PROT|nr:hypothetical protein FH063_004712 [Azospirillum argentinense]